MQYKAVAFVCGLMMAAVVMPAHAEERCPKLVEKLRDCEPYACQMRQGEDNLMHRHQVIGKTPNGKCHYKQIMPVRELPVDLTLDCLFDKDVRRAYSNALRRQTGQVIDETEEAMLLQDEKTVNEALAQDVCDLLGL